MLMWRTSRRVITFERPKIMAILNITPDSFSDGGKIITNDDALRRADQVIKDGADILDIGGESTRPGSSRVPENEEIRRTAPVIEAVAKRFDIPISIDTTKSSVAEAAISAGAEIINDISGLRFEPSIAAVAAKNRAGLILMHSRGDFASMHSQPSVSDILNEVSTGFARSINTAIQSGVAKDHISLDIGIGFGKTVSQNLELLAKLDKLAEEYPEYPILVGASRKSFIGSAMGGAAVNSRLNGSIAAAVIAVWNGAAMVRVHDVRETADAFRVANAIRGQL
ncbi:MAG TPA: dihydropteroate synthase [Blastocatellia bacterium]|nr:dihydropteroate synthase [Blastocatellia bacterium]